MITITDYTKALNAVTLNGNLERDPMQKATHTLWKDEEAMLMKESEAMHDSIIQSARGLSKEEIHALRTQIPQAMAQVIDASAPNSPYPLFKA